MFQLIVTDERGLSSPPNSVTIAVLMVPGQVMSVAAESTSRRTIRLSWNASTSAVTGYDVQRRTTTGMFGGDDDLHRANLQGTSFFDRLFSLRLYYYRVRARNGDAVGSVVWRSEI